MTKIQARLSFGPYAGNASCPIVRFTGYNNLSPQSIPLLPFVGSTFTVIAAVLPMAFVSGMMGPYMSPMPIGASIAMMLALFAVIFLLLLWDRYLNTCLFSLDIYFKI